MFVKVEYVFKRVGDFEVVKHSVKKLWYDSVWSMCCYRWNFCYSSLLAIQRKKVGEPKEEIRNLYGFHMNSSNDEFTCTNLYT
jgi:hypothetical protein